MKTVQTEIDGKGGSASSLFPCSLALFLLAFKMSWLCLDKGRDDQEESSWASQSVKSANVPF